MCIFSKKGEKTRQSIISAAMDLFYVNGFQGTSVDEVLKTSKTGKSQFYHYFKSKEDLIHQCLVQIHEHIIEARESGKTKIKNWEDLNIWFSTQVEMQEKYGLARSCPLSSLSGDPPEQELIILQDVANIFDALCVEPELFFKAEAEAGRLKNDADPKALALYCLSSFMGGGMVSKIKQTPDAMENAIDQTMKYLLSHKK